MHEHEARLKLLQWFQKGILSINPENLFSSAIDNKEDVLLIENNLVKKKQSVHVLSVGKAALPMARATSCDAGSSKKVRVPTHAASAWSPQPNPARVKS